jgi:3-oxoacyl-[acyl-carrier protein] reductase
MSMGELSGQVAFVTGGAKNIGRAICLALAEGGAAVAVNTQHSVAEAQEVVDEIAGQGGKALLCAGDISQPEDIKRMVGDAVAALGGLTILVNNASVRRIMSFDEMTPEEWRAIMAVNLDACFFMAQAAVPHMRRAGGGAIVNIGGISGHTGVKSRSHVATSKAAVAGMSRALAHDLADDRITVNTVVPGIIDTVRGSNAGTSPPNHPGGHFLLGRKGTPAEIAGMVRTLCGPGGRYTTGQTIHINGGAFMT